MFSLRKRGMSKASGRVRSAITRATKDLVRTLMKPPAKPAARKTPVAAKAAKPAPAKSAVAKSAVAKSAVAKSAVAKSAVAKSAVAKTRAPVPLEKPRAGLGETIARLKADRMPATARGPAATPRGASFRAGVYANDTAERSYKLYVPACAAAPDPAAMPLIVMLHGCGQTPDDFARGTRMNQLAEEFGFLVVYPAQPSAANAGRCWNWYRPGDQGRGAGEPALIAGIARRILSEQAVDPARVYIAGMSAGGAAAVIVAAAYPELFAAACVHSGLPVGAAHNPASAMLAMRRGAPGIRPTVAMPTITFHGDADTVVHPRNGRYLEARSLVAFPPMRKSVKVGTSAGGRRFVRGVYRIGSGKPMCEAWVIEGAGHAWAGGSASGSFADPAGPDASREMVRFFMRHRVSTRGLRGR